MKLILNIILLLVIISTVSICTIKPSMHKTVMVYDSAYTIVPEKQVEVEKETIPIMEKTVEPIKTVTKSVPETQTEVKQIKKNETVKTTQQKTAQTKNTAKTETKTSAVQQKQIQNASSAPKQQERTVVVKQITAPKTVTTTQTTKPKTLTQQEELIAWNIWRSNLQNKIMQDTKLPIMPTGVVFKFSFTVDKFGKISNLQTWSESSTYTPYAIQYIAPVIRSYQGRSILNFPEGTERVTTEVRGGWKISENEKYSTPQDYHDIEKVVK